MTKQRSNSLSEQIDADRNQRLMMETEKGQEQIRRLESDMQNQMQMNAENQTQMQPDINVKPRRRSIFEMRGPLGSDRFSREYADAMDDMWIAQCDQGDAGHAGVGILQGPLFKRRVSLGQDGFSREYFDAMEDTFIAETDHGDSGFLYNNPHQPTFNRIPDGLRRLSQTLYRPVKIGSDEFSREYAREGEDVWLAQAGKGPSARAPSELMRRVRLGSDGDGSAR